MSRGKRLKEGPEASAVTAEQSGGAVARDAVIGAAAGVAATIAMTLAADALFRRLPPGERYPLPPRELTERTAASAGLQERLSERGLQAATLAAHFGFGAAAGALFAPLFLRRPLGPVASGVAYSAMVWTASYFGWVPALGLLRPATRHPLRRNGLMLAVHVVWGSVLGLLADRLSRSLAPVAGGPHRDR